MKLKLKKRLWINTGSIASSVNIWFFFVLGLWLLTLSNTH